MNANGCCAVGALPNRPLFAGGVLAATESLCGEKVKAGFGEVRVEKGAGALASYGDAGCCVRKKMDRAGPLARERSETVELPPRIRRDAALREISAAKLSN